jgi:UDP-N-acetylglucosamine 2-epimerase (non-hydrolysing)
MGKSRVQLPQTWVRQGLMLRVLSIFGTRPEAVKMAPVIQALRARPEIESRICVTAQHRQMLDQVLDLFNLHPDFDLDLMRHDQTLAGLTAKIFTQLDPLLEKEKPDWILVQGDTTTVMAASLNAFYQHIRVGHVEAGLRTGDRSQPFPEEINRRVASVVAELHFAPTGRAVANLQAEGIPDWRIALTGNPVIDALNAIVSKPVPADVSDFLTEKDIRPGLKKMILVTAHRRENFGAPIESICLAIRDLASDYPDQVELVYPVHLNPNIQEPVHRLLDGIPNVTLLPPLEYLSLVHMMRASELVLTDSGGIQEEATGLGKPTLVLREVTERPEGLEAGVLNLVGTDRERIVQETKRLLEDHEAYEKMAHASNPFGDGHASEKIVSALLAFQDRSSPAAF